MVSDCPVAPNGYSERMSTEAVPVTILRVIPTPTGSGVFLTAEGKIVSIFIDPMATRALHLALSGESTPRPLTHELMVSVFGGLGVRLLGVHIYGYEDETFFARLMLEQENELGKNLVEVDARPSDGMVLATQLDVPITVDRGVWEQSEDMSWAIEKFSSEEES